MALTRLAIDGYGQFEPNNFSAPRTGRIEAQCKLDATDFATSPVENGMIVAVDKLAGTVLLADSAAITAKLPLAVVYSTEHLYDQFKPGLKNFKTTTVDFLPRLGYPAIGDTYTTNALAYDGAVYADDDAFVDALVAAATAFYAVPSALGAVQVTAVAPSSGMIWKVVKVTTMPDGQFGLKLQLLAV